MLTTTFDVELVWDGRYTVKVTVPESYWNRTCGLCGTYDGDEHNEYRRPDGSLVRKSSLVKFIFGETSICSGELKIKGKLT